ncbi:MAG TPA: IS200/IS605 family transposase [Prolixibacteraceae bacterium]|nr:IS200/IS605 family transposase [Prolixibacteraceae bacterium]
MASTYSQIYLHFVFAVQNRISLICPNWQVELYKYMSGIITNAGHKTYAINGMPDHVYALVSMNPEQAPSDLMHDVKRSSTLWINENHFVLGKFSWQEGFGVFSYGKSQIPGIANYIEQQKKHHAKRTFIEEYIQFLKLFDIEYDERYIYKPIE